MKAQDVQMGRDRRPDDKPVTPRPVRNEPPRGPVGFGHVMRQVRGGKGQGKDGTPGKRDAPGEGRDGAGSTAGKGAGKGAGAGRHHGVGRGRGEQRGAAGAAPRTEAEELRQLMQERETERGSRTGEAAPLDPRALPADSVMALEAARVAALVGGEAVGSMGHVAHAAEAQGASAVPAAWMGNLSPEQTLRTVLDEARKLELAEAGKDLHIELDPVHLGPLIVRIRVEQGRIRTDFRARDEAAVARLRTGQDGLRERLEGLGYSTAEVTVEQDAAVGGTRATLVS